MLITKRKVGKKTIVSALGIFPFNLLKNASFFLDIQLKP